MRQVFKNGPSKICGKQPLKKFEVIWSAKVFLELQYLVYDLIDFLNLLCLSTLLYLKQTTVFDEVDKGLGREKKKHFSGVFYPLNACGIRTQCPF